MNTSWPYDIMTFFSCLSYHGSIKVAKWQYGKSKVGKKAQWPNGKMTKWQNGKTAKWQNGKMAKWQNGNITKARLPKKPNDTMAK